MSWLKIYDWEHQTYPEFQKVKIGRSDAPRYFRKFSRHFKIDSPDLSHRVRRGGGGVYYGGYRGVIKLSHTPSLGIVIHEFAHHLADRTNGKRNGHNKAFKRALKKSYTFARRYLPKELPIIESSS